MTGTEAPEILRADDDGVRVLTLNAPARRNALSPSMRATLREALRAALEDRAIRVIVLTGADGNFSAGGDIRHMSESSDPQTARQRLEILHDCVRLIVDGAKPVVAAVEGYAFGAGFSLACACDHLVAGRGSAFSAAFGRLGLVADCGLFWSLPQRAGLGLARDLMLTGRRIDAPQAFDAGIVDALADDGTALERALAKAREYLPIGPLAIAATKSALARRPASLEDALAIEADLQSPLRMSEDHRDAVQAFLDKRPARFQGR